MISVLPVSRVACTHRTWRHSGTSRVTIVVKTTFQLVHGSTAKQIEAEPISSDVHETAPYLPGAGVLLQGHARSPGGARVPSMSVRLAVYRQQALLDKTIHVYGDRGQSAQPEPFAEMPLSWDRARRGGGDNPLGRDAHNLVDPVNPRRPAGFGPLLPEWPSRRRLFGAVDPGTLKAPGVELPAGFDWRALHAAPPDQIIGLLAGDEWIVLDGVHYTLPRLQTQLPGIRAAARWHTVQAGELGPANDLTMYGDLLMIDADREICSVVWRGSFVLHDGSPETQVFVGSHTPGTTIDWPQKAPRRPRTVAVRSDRPAGVGALPFVAATGTRPAILDMKPPEVSLPAGAASRPGTTLPPDDDDAPPSLPFQRPPRSAPPAPPPSDIIDEPSVVTDPIVESEARRAVMAKLEAGAAFSDDSYPNADLRGLDFSDRMMSGCNLTGADLRGASLAKARLQDAKLTSADLRGADLSGADLARVDGRKAHLDDANLEGATMTDADFSLSQARGAQATKLNGARLRLVQADWSGAQLSHANLPDSDLAGARVLGARFVQTNLDGSRMNDLKGDEAIFDDGDVSRAHLVGASLVGASLRNAAAIGATFDNANLEDADFSGATLRQLSLIRAQLVQATFERADLTKAHLRHAAGDAPVFRDARLDDADLRQARLPGAVFDRATLRKVIAVRADFSRGSFVGADLSNACLRPARLAGCNLSRAKVAGADFRDADLSNANLFGVDRQTAKLAGCKLRDVVEQEPPNDAEATE